jgi:hypothetical protein
MAERLHTNEQSPEKNELQEAAQAQNERLAENRERAAELLKDTEPNKTEKARENLDKVIEKDREKKTNETEAATERQPKRTTRTKKSLESSFKVQMKDARREMSAPSRAFSKLIHNKAVEKTSEAVGSTIARPNAILSGSLFAFILTASLYFWAKYVGYPLSGFETIGAFIIGWLVGMIFDFTRIMFTGKS